MKENEIHLKDYLKIVMARRYVVILFFITTLAVVIIDVYTSLPLYKATTGITVEKNELDNLVAPRAARFFYDDDEMFLFSQEQVITSYDVAEKVLEKLKQKVAAINEKKDAHKTENEADENAGGVEEDLTNYSGKFTNMPDIVATLTAHEIVSNIRVSSDNESKTIYISFVSSSPELAAATTNFVVDAYIEQTFAIGTKTAKVSQDWMNKKAREALQTLEKSERKLQEYMKENDILTVENRIAIVPQKLAQISNRLTTAEAERKEKEAVYDSIIALPESLTDADTIPVITNDRSLQEIQEQMVKADQEIMRLSNKYGAKHPVMIRAANNLEILTRKKRQIIEKLIKYEKNSYYLAKSKEDNLRKLFLATKEEVVALNDKIVGYGILKKDVESNRELYETLINKVKEQYLLEDVQPVNIRVIEKAAVPAKPFSPRKKRNIMLGLIVGLFGGIGLAFFMDYLDQTIKTPYDISKRVDIPVLATIPLYNEKGKKIEDMVLNEPLSPIAEAYKSIRMFIFFSARKKLANTILVTSGVHGDGKTATAVNLAVAIAQSNASVLLIDADLREPRIHDILNLDNSRGLSTILAGVPNSAGGSIKRGPVAKMSVITSGPMPEDPSEMIGSKRMSVLLRKIEKRYDYIIFDSPVVTVTESLIIARYVDGTIIVTRAGKTTYNMLEEELLTLKNVNASVFGLVINGASA